MCHSLYALRIEPSRLVATEITDRAAAASLDAGEPVLLGNVQDLHILAQRLRLPLVTIARTRGLRRSGGNPRAETEDHWSSCPTLLAEVA